MNQTSTRTYLRWIHSEIEKAEEKKQRTRVRVLIEAREQFCLLSEIPVPTPEALFEKQKKKSVVFDPPTLAEVEQYALTRNSKVDPREWHAYYAARNWCFKDNSKMRNWKAAFVRWERSEYTRNDSRMRAADQARLEDKARKARTQLRLMQEQHDRQVS